MLLYFLNTFKAVLIPVCFAGLFSLLLLPMVQWLEKRIHKVAAILISLFLIIIVLSLLIWFLSAQIGSFSSELDEITGKMSLLINKFQLYLQDTFGIKPTNRSDFIEKALGNVTQTGSAMLGSTISLTTGAFTVLTLVPIYVFCMLYYRDHLRKFMFQFVTTNRRGKVMATVDDIQRVVQGYLSGLFIVILIVSMLNSIGLLVMGVKYAIFFGVFASFLNIIPYIGILIGAMVPAFFVFISTGSIGQAMIVVGIFAFVQFLEGNFITPYIVGSKVSINPFAAILALIVGGEIWGASGMILAIPVIAILKVLFDAYEPLRPLGYLLCDINETPKENKYLKRIVKLRKKE